MRAGLQTSRSYEAMSANGGSGVSNLSAHPGTPSPPPLPLSPEWPEALLLSGGAKLFLFCIARLHPVCGSPAP